MRRALLSLSVLAFVACAKAPPISISVPMTELQSRAAADSVDAVAHYNLGIGYWIEENYAAARTELERAVELDTRFAQAYLALGFLPYAERPALWREVARGEVPVEYESMVDVANQHYRRALMIDPLVDMAILAAVVPPVDRYWQVGGPFHEAYDTWFRGLDDYRDGDYVNAYRRYTNLILDLERYCCRDARERMPEAILLYRGLAAAHLGRWEVATGDIRILYERERTIEDEDELIHVPLDTNHYRYMLGVLLARSGALEEADSLLREAAAADLGLYMAHVHLADLAEQRGDVPAALAERQRAVNANPDDASLHLDLGVSYARQGMLTEAAGAVENAIVLNPSAPAGWYIIGVIRAARAENDAARAAFERFIALAPSRMAAQIEDARTRLVALGAN